MRRVTVTIPDDLEDDLERFLASQEVRPAIGSVMRTALRRFVSQTGTNAKPSLLHRVLSNRETIRALAVKRRISSIRLFGSVARGEDTRDSDIDFLVSPKADCGLFNLGGLQVELEELLGVEVDVVSDRSVPPEVRDELEAEAIPL